MINKSSVNTNTPPLLHSTAKFLHYYFFLLPLSDYYAPTLQFGVRRAYLATICSSYLHSSMYKYQPISTKLGLNIYDCEISDEFDYGSNRTGRTGVICPRIRKLLYFTLFTLQHLQISTSEHQR